MLYLPAVQLFCATIRERQSIAVSRKIHVQHGGAVARDGDGLGLVGVIGEVGIVAACEALAHIIAAAHLRAGVDVCRFIRSGDAVFICAVCLGVGVLVPENDGEAGLIPLSTWP